MSIPPVESHLVVFPLEAWGHARPLITLCARVAKAGTTMITFFTTILFVERAKAELLRDFETGEDVFLTRIRIVGLENTGIFTSRALEDAFATAWRKLDVGEVVCVKTGTPFPSGPRPNAVIFDCFAHQSLRDAKAISGDGVKAYMWFPGPLSSFFNIFGPESLGGKGNIRLKAEEEARRTGKSPVEVVSEMFQVRGNVIRAPGMPPMYDYEHEPQDFPLAEEATTKVLFIPAYESLMITDGVFIVTSESYEPEAVVTLRGWYKELSKPAHIVGPLLPSGTRALAEEKQQSPLAQAIETFLDETLQTSGKQSLLYISFGSVFWPVKNPDTVWAFLDVVMELGIPFIFSHASPFAGVLPDAITAKVKAYGKGLLSPWSPQQSILNHPATAWFVSHGGQNGAFEAITAGVPLIMWPFSFDQPLNAVHLSESLGIAYELIEVRSGHGLKPILRNGRKAAGTPEALQAEARDVLAKAFGEDGAKKRVKLQQLRSEVLSEWEEGGASKRDFLAFLDTLSKTT